MKIRKDTLKLLFDREHMAMKLYYQYKLRKIKTNKTLKKKSKQFDNLIDEGVRDLLINEWFDICRKYCRVQLIIWSLTKKTILFKCCKTDESEDEFNINYNDHKHFPVVISNHDSFEIFKE